MPTIGTMNYNPLSFDEANPWLTGFNKAQEGILQGQQTQNLRTQNQLAQAQLPYANQMAQQDLLKSQLANKILQSNANLADPMAQAKLQQAQAQPGLTSAQSQYYNANAANTQAQTNLTNLTTPSKVLASQADVFKDPVLSRLLQLHLAQQNGLIDTSALTGGQPQQPNAQPQQQTNVPFAQPGAPNYVPGLQHAANMPLLPGGTTRPLAQVAQQADQGPGYNPVTAPKLFSGDAATNWAMFGTPYNPVDLAALKKGAETQAASNVTQYSDALKTAADNGQLGTQTKSLLDQFQDSYAKSNYKGGIKGQLNPQGITSIPARALGEDLSNEQMADNASQNIAALVAKMIAGGRVTNNELQFVNSMKPNRLMDPQTAQVASDFLKQKSIRLNEEQGFLNTAKNQGTDVQVAQQLWQQYNDQRPVYDFSNRKPNTQFQGSWREFLKPDIVNAVRNGQTVAASIPKFNNQSQFHSWYLSLPSDVRQVVKSQLPAGGQ